MMLSPFANFLTEPTDVNIQFVSFDELAAFAKAAKRAGVSTLMLEKINKMNACPGSWYGGLQVC